MKVRLGGELCSEACREAGEAWEGRRERGTLPGSHQARAEQGRASQQHDGQYQNQSPRHVHPTRLEQRAEGVGVGGAAARFAHHRCNGLSHGQGHQWGLAVATHTQNRGEGGAAAAGEAQGVHMKWQCGSAQWPSALHPHFQTHRKAKGSRPWSHVVMKMQRVQRTSVPAHPRACWQSMRRPSLQPPFSSKCCRTTAVKPHDTPSSCIYITPCARMSSTPQGASPRVGDEAHRLGGAGGCSLICRVEAHGICKGASSAELRLMRSAWDRGKGYQQAAHCAACRSSCRAKKAD